MLYLQDIKDDMFFIKDLDDNSIEAISESELFELVSKFGDMFIRGCCLSKDGILVYHILNPDLFKFQSELSFEQYFGLVSYTRYNQKSILIEYRSYTDLLCLFETGKIYEYNSFDGFKHGYLPFKNSAHLGEMSISTAGQKMWLVDYIDCKNSTIRFEDGTLRSNISYGCFKKGQVKNPNLHNGEISYSSKGEKMILQKFWGAKNIDVLFEDGTLVTGKFYDHFIKREIANPNYYRNKYIDSVSFATTGQKMKIVDYINSEDVIIKFEDGTVVHDSISHFFKGYVRNPNYTPHDKYMEEKLGEKSISFSGLSMEIIRYSSFKDIDVLFEDGYISRGCRYDHFKNGLIYNPSCANRSIIERLIAYYFSLCIPDVQFNIKPSYLEGMEYDIFIPSKGIAIEVDGYFHSLDENIKKDVKKGELSVQNGIRLFRVRDFYCSSKCMDLVELRKTATIIEADSCLDPYRQFDKALLELNRVERLLFEQLNLDVSCINYDLSVFELCK